MKIDKIEGKPDDRVAWGSDIAAQMLRRFGIPYISLNPGASYRGLHDSLVNHLGNVAPGIIICLHEDHSVAIAHGYARATGEPMACVLHSNVGLLHGMMGLFNAWCDRVPMIVLGATGPVAAEKRRPWIDWIHSSRDQGAYIRSIIKWDDQPTSPDALVESLTRANLLTRTAPTAPVYIVLDAGFQEQKLDKEPEWPDVSRFKPPAPARPSKSAVDDAVRQARAVGKVSGHIIACTLDQNLHTGANMEYQALPTVDVLMGATGDVVVAELLEALGAGHRDPWKAKVPAKAKAANGTAI